MSKSKRSLLHRIGAALTAISMVWLRETRKVLRDQGVILFFFVAPPIYPLLYSWIYNNETVRDVDIAVVDKSHSALSRQFIRMCDASPDLHIAYHCTSLDEAKDLVGRQVSYGTIYIPSDFAECINRGEQAHISLLTDMTFMLNYKAMYLTAISVSTAMNANIQVAASNTYTDREDELLTHPLDYEEVVIFNPTGGYGSFILPGALILIIQQTLLLGIGLIAGTSRERRWGDKTAVPLPKAQTTQPLRYAAPIHIIGKGLCYFIIYLPLTAYVTMIVPRIFRFTAIGNVYDLTMVLLPFLLAVIFFGLTISALVRYRENVILLIVFASVPLLFLSGVSWPISSIPSYLQGLSWLFPSTFGIQGYMRINSMGATLGDVHPEVIALWAQAIVYFGTACLVYSRQRKGIQQGAEKRD